MVRKSSRVSFAVLLSCMTIVLSGCFRVSIDPSEDLRSLFPVNERIHARVGVYISEDLRNYILEHEKTGMNFRMEIGKYLVPIAMQMAGAMFDEAVEIDSLPPYMGDYRPDVEAIVEPEILYACGNAAGAFSGRVEAKVKLRIKAYDLSGKAIWQGEALGESSGDRVDFVTTFLGHMGEVDRVGYQAGIFAAQTIIREFNSNRPSELYSLLEVKAPVQPKSQKISTSSVDQSDKLYQKGLYHFEKKNFEQALHGFQQAERQNPDDPVIKFYVGICRMYTGQRARALDNLKSIIAQNPKDNKLIGDCRSWVQRLNDPLKISIVFVGSEDSFPAVLRNSYVNALTDCGMYDIVDVRNVQDSDIHNNKSALKKCLQESSKKNARVAILVQGVSFAREVMDSGLSDGDLATEFELSTDVRAYGIRKKNAVLDCLLTDSTTRLNKLTEPEKLNLHAALAQRSSNRLVLSLLGNEIF